jgi:hypothetical protein
MTVCPIAVVAGCAKCPAFRICPLKGVLGDAPPKSAAVAAPAPMRGRAKPRKKSA